MKAKKRLFGCKIEYFGRKKKFGENVLSTCNDEALEVIFINFCFSVYINRREAKRLGIRNLEDVSSVGPSSTNCVLHRSESRNCGLCVVYIQKDGATLLVGAW